LIENGAVGRAGAQRANASARENFGHPRSVLSRRVKLCHRAII
jgi:hypothetical protein